LPIWRGFATESRAPRRVLPTGVCWLLSQRGHAGVRIHPPPHPRSDDVEGEGGVCTNAACTLSLSHWESRRFSFVVTGLASRGPVCDSLFVVGEIKSFCLLAKSSVWFCSRCFDPLLWVKFILMALWKTISTSSSLLFSYLIAGGRLTKIAISHYYYYIVSLSIHLLLDLSRNFVLFPEVYLDNLRLKIKLMQTFKKFI